jgi:4-amino-4-deoxy-L-arabinose transferase-like glycosyltransferase
MLSRHCGGESAVPTHAPLERPAWREAELLLLLLLVAGVFFPRLTDLTIRGEEPRWARVAQEMLDTGDWIVPRQQGQPFADRPPLNSWAMMAASRVTGGLNLAAIRLPSVLATLLTTLAVYLYGRNFLSRAAAFAAGAMYATMGLVLHLGRVAESDSLLTALVVGSLLAWHYGHGRRDPRLAWLGGFALAALAALAKGPQGPLYFVAITATFLGLRRDWRFLFCRWYLAGVAVFVLVVGSWYVPFWLALDARLALRVWTEEGNLGSRFEWTSLARAMKHWAEFPLEVFGSMLPWSFMLPVLFTRWFRGAIGPARPYVAFLSTACVVVLPTCWLPLESRPRHLMSLYPCVALLIGLVVERSALAPQIGWWRRSWDNFLLTGTALILGAPLVLGALPLLAGDLPARGRFVSSTFIAVYSASAITAAMAVRWSRRRPPAARVQVGVLALAGFFGLSYSGIVISAQASTSNDPRAQVAALRQGIPPGERLVSFGLVHHLFAYYYAQPIEYVSLDGHRAPHLSTATYFCFAVDPGFPSPTIPFAWQQVAEVSCDRARSDHPRARVIVGKRLTASDVARRPLDRHVDGVSPASFIEALPAAGSPPPTAD